MKSYKLTKSTKLFRNQFEDFAYDVFQDHRISRISLDLDAILFRIKYIIRKNIDINEIKKLEDEFTELSGKLRSEFTSIIYQIICKIITIPEPFKADNIIDLIVQDVKIDQSFVSFKLILISDRKEFLDYIDSKYEDDRPFNIYPGKMFRFFTDSYNDGIAKAYPELFENKRQDVIGSGADKDVFVHSITLQVGEACSLNCTYCFAAGTKIYMSDFTTKNIEDIKVGDKVLSVNEYNDAPRKQRIVKETIVTNIMSRTSGVYLLHHPALNKDIYVTPDHPFLNGRGEWKPIKDINPHDGIYITDFNLHYLTNLQSIKNAIHGKGLVNLLNHSCIHRIHNFTLAKTDRIETVYNFETESHTYIAEGCVVHNCYQFNKTPMRMTFDIAKKFIDDLLADKYGYVNRYNSPAAIIEFIGGEPLLEIKLIREVYEYFLDKTYESHHPWFKMHRLSICSNGLQYFDNEVQRFFKDYHSQVSFNISIDGNKELHDACRIQPNGEGSYDIDIMALNHYNKYYAPERNSKMTLAPSNIKYLYDSVVNFINNGMTVINLNCVFEEGWTTETAHTEYIQLKKLADYIIDNDLEYIYISIFNERAESKLDEDNDSNFCGGVGSMLALRPNGDFYPCIRYMPSSVGNNEDMVIGNVYDGIHERSSGTSEVLNMLDKITRRSQTNDICFNCPIASNCAGCSALGYTVFGTPNKKTTFHCIQVIAESLANVYYWNKLYRKHPDWGLKPRKNNVPIEWALLVLNDEEYNELKSFEIK